MSTNGMEIARVVPPHEMQVIRRDDDLFMPVMAIERAVQRYNAIVQFTKEIMKPGKDFGEIPGTDKPTLLKPGAEKLCSFFGLTPKFIIVEKTELWDGAEPFFYYWYKCQLWRGDRLIGEGDGSANSRESKYRYRWVNESNLPPGLDKSKCEARGGRITEFEFAIDKAETSGKYGKPASYWQSFKDAIEKGTATRVMKPLSKGGDRPAWTIDSTVFRVPNPDVCDSVNTLQKMSQKRAFIAATLIACNASEYYTQDLEDLDTIDGAPLPDTGGHPVGTQAAANHVAETKIADMKRERERERASTPPPPKSAAEEVPAEVQAMWAAMKDLPSTIKVFGNLKKNLGELIGEDAGYRLYYGVLGKHGAEHANQFKSTKPARLAARELLEAVRAAQQPPVADDSDVPEFFPGDDVQEAQ